MGGIPEGAQLSKDGNYWWDGNEWQPVQGQAGHPGEVTAEHLEPVGDIGAEPGFDELITEVLKPYFEPDVDGIPDDDSESELPEVLDDSEYAATSGQA